MPLTFEVPCQRKARCARWPVFVAVVSLGCSEPVVNPPPPPPTPTRLVIVGGDDGRGEVGSTLPNPVTVRALAVDRPLAGVAVTFAELTGGSVVPAQVTTDERGEARASWTLGTRAIEAVLEARVFGLPPIRAVATAVPGPPDSVEHTDTPGGLVGQYFEPRPYVRITDRFGNPIHGLEVRFEIRSGGGALDGSTVSTDDGLAAVPRWRLGPSAARQSVVARVPASGDSVRLEVNGAAARIVGLGGGSVVKSWHFAPGLSVTLFDALDQPMPGAVVELTTTGGMVLGPLRHTADHNGQVALTDWRLPTDPGDYALSAQAFPEGPRAILNVTAVRPDPARLEAVSGDQQTGLAGNFLPGRLAVRVLDADQEPIAGVTVQWTAGSGGRVGQPGTQTDTLGMATTDGWRLGPGIGVQSVSASLVGLSAPFRAAATAVPPSAFKIATRSLGLPLDSAMTQALAGAVARWERVILADLPDVRIVNADSSDRCLPVMDEVVDDVLALVVVDSIDGPGDILGGAAPCVLRSGSRGLPAAGILVLDIADVRQLSAPALRDLLIHELGHILGIGSLWEERHLVAGDSRVTYAYGGPFARAALNGLVRPVGPALDSVPVDNSAVPGSEHVHWSEFAFDLGPELMTPFINAVNPLSALTTASLRDLGYLTADAASDPFLAAVAGASRARPAPRVPLRELKLAIPLKTVPAVRPRPIVRAGRSRSAGS